MARPAKHTYESLKGVFVPCPLPSASHVAGGRVVVGEKNMNPSMSVAATRRMADKSILAASNRLGRGSGHAGGGHAGGGHAGEDDVQDPTYRQPSSASASSSDEDESNSEDGSEDDESDSDDESKSGSSSSASSSESSSESEESDDEESRRARKRRKKAQQQQQQNPLGAANRCFLCDYCTSKEVRFVSTFISDNIANMEVGLMSEQIRKYIFDKRPEYATGNHGLEVQVIRRHIRQHMLSPTVRIADMMRHLLKLCDTLRGNLERVDPDTGESSADRSNIDTYLKVVTKVLDMYKMSETNKMLFANAEK